MNITHGYSVNTCPTIFSVSNSCTKHAVYSYYNSPSALLSFEQISGVLNMNWIYMHIERDENESEKLDSSLEIKSSCVFGIVLKNIN